MFVSSIFTLLAIVLLIVGVKGIVSGAYAFSHNERLAVTRRSNPVWYWIQAFMIFGAAALLLWAAFY